MKWLGIIVILFGIESEVAAQTGRATKDAGRTKPLEGSSSRADDSRAAREAGSILVGKCLSCHGAEKKKGGLDLTRRSSALSGGESGAAIVPGQPDESLLIEKVAAGDMPPNGPLSREQVAAVRAWVESGATYPTEPLSQPRAGVDWWSLRPVRRLNPPRYQGPDAARVRTPIDAFILAGLESAGLRPAPEADRATLIRRLTFDLTGLPPTPEAGRRVPRRPRPPGVRGRSSIGCWPRPSTASAGAGTGSMSSGSARARAMRPTCRGRRHGPIAIT